MFLVVVNSTEYLFTEITQAKIGLAPLRLKILKEDYPMILKSFGLFGGNSMSKGIDLRPD